MNWADMMKYRTDEIIEQMNAIINCEDKGDRALMMARLMQILERITQEGEE
tara:strand:+ start:137 stop:289 length:153 start_codon:yes stop_codon:yes gene_type:complete